MLPHVKETAFFIHKKVIVNVGQVQFKTFETKYKHKKNCYNHERT